jgi:predicted  nucleic acid-binding Zn-ribbon protein
MTKEDFDAEVYEYAKSRNGTEDSRMTDRMLAYRAGAEPREKRISELEKELEFEKSVNGEFSAMDKLRELEKENAELKDDNKVMADNYSKMEQKFYNNLTKAKDLLKRCYENYIYLEPLRSEIEQFLNSEVAK